MRRRRASRHAQRGMALLALVAVAVMAFAYVLTTRLNAASRFVGVDRDHNAMVMAQAKRALIGWVAMNAAGTDANPGRLPCPEAAGDFGTVNEGRAAGNCTLPAVGRLPWRTLGLDKLVDAAGEPLWYVVSSGWALPCGTCNTVINSDSPGQLPLDGVPNDAVAFIIAPGPAIVVQAGAGCTAWPQARPAAGPPDLRNYLECGNASGGYLTSAVGQTFNDQVLRVAAADVKPALEAAIAERMQREIAPALKSAYGSATWGTSAGNPLYPFARPFENPTTSNFKGVSGTDQGLLPFVYSETSAGSGTPCSADPRCDPLFVAWTLPATLSGPSIHSPSCSVVAGSTTRLDCTFYYTCALLLCTPPTLNYTIQARVTNVGMTLRQINMSAPIGSANVSATLASATASFDSAGAATLTLTGTATPDGSGGFLSALLGNTFCGLPIIGPLLGCKPSLISVPIGVLADHPLLDVSNPTYGWFARNGWHQLVYYAAAPHSSPAGLAMAGGLGCTSSDCLRFNDSGVKNIRALLVLAGRRIGYPAPARPSATLADYLEYNNADGLTMYEQRPIRQSNVSQPTINAPWNDRVVLVDWSSSLLADQAVVSTPVVRTVALP